MKKNVMSLAVAATLGLAAFSALAEDMYRGAWYALPGVSLMNADSDLEANNGGGAFIKLGKELSPKWDIQGGLGYNRANEDTGIAGMGGRYKQTTLSVDALYMFSRDSFRPFLLAGLGAARNNVDYSAPAGYDISDDSNTSWMANVGLGAQYLINDSFGLQADLRHQWSRASAKVTDLNTGASITDSGRIGNTLLNFGGIFRFGAPAPMPVAAVVPEPAPVAPAPVVVAPEPEPAPAPAPEPAPEVCQPKFKTITISAEKLFAFDKFSLTRSATTELYPVVDTLKEHPEFDLVLVVGHTDFIGTEQYNQKLSENRAKTVREYLIAHGIDGSRLSAVGKGESQPVVECKGIRGNALIECLKPNRRVVIEGQRKHPVNECK